jgi:enoyl-CoA hydratase/carnithine racemase
MRADFNTLAVVESNGVVQLVLNRPEVRNAFSHEMMTELDIALDEAEIDPDVGAVVLRGEGKLFSAGHDLKEHNSGNPFHLRTFPHASPSVRPALPRAWYFRKPLIGALHSYVGPYAIALVACCDFNIAATGTRFSCEVFTGTYPDIEWLPLYLQLPMRVIEKLWLVGGWMDAEQALQFQLVQRVVPEDEVLDEALRWAQHAARVPSDRFAHGKDKIRRSIELLGLDALPSVLDRHPSAVAPADRRGEEFASSIKEKGLQETMRDRNAGIDPAITKV